MYLDNPKLAIEFARKALRLDPNNLALQNTLGLALEFAARSGGDPLLRQALLSEATRIFDEGIRRNPTDPYGYIGKVFIIRQLINREHESLRKTLLKADALSLLQVAYEATGESPIIVNQLAIQRNQLGTPEEAIDVLRVALERDPTNTRLRDLWIQLEIERMHLAEALKLALEGVKYDPTSWRIQRHIARLKQRSGESIDAVKGHYEAAIRHHRGDAALLVELGAYLFMNHQYSVANSIFSQSRDLPLSTFEKQKIREWWLDADGNLIVFSGKVKSIRRLVAYAFVIPNNFEAFFWRSAKLFDLHEGDPIKFNIGFNAFGPIAQIL